VKLPVLFAVVDEGVILKLAYCQSERSWAIYELVGSDTRTQTSADGRLLPIENRAHMLSILGAAPSLTGAMTGIDRRMIVVEDVVAHDLSKLLHRMRDQSRHGALDEIRCRAKAVEELPESEKHWMRLRFGLAQDDPRQHSLTHLSEREGLSRDWLKQIELRVHARARELLEDLPR